MLSAVKYAHILLIQLLKDYQIEITLSLLKFIFLINFLLTFSASSTPAPSTSGGGTCTRGASRSAWRTSRASPSSHHPNPPCPQPLRPAVGAHKWRHHRGRSLRHRLWSPSKRLLKLSTLFERFSEVLNRFKLPSLRWTSKNFFNH